MCQGSDARSREIPELSAGAQHVAATTFPDEDVDAGLAHDRLERQDVEVGRPAEGTAGKWVEGNQIDLACDPADQFDQTQGIGLAIVHAGEQHIFKRQPSGAAPRDTGGRRAAVF